MLNMRNPLSGLLPDLGSMKWFSLNASLPGNQLQLPFPEHRHSGISILQPPRRTCHST
ncbi:MAG UNVERIFIED_CONTAM: hypothetical protein LVR18_02970 [Planctomycetaceae bacterium]